MNLPILLSSQSTLNDLKGEKYKFTHWVVLENSSLNRLPLKFSFSKRVSESISFSWPEERVPQGEGGGNRGKGGREMEGDFGGGDFGGGGGSFGVVEGTLGGDRGEDIGGLEGGG